MVTTSLVNDNQLRSIRVHSTLRRHRHESAYARPNLAPRPIRTDRYGGVELWHRLGFRQPIELRYQPTSVPPGLTPRFPSRTVPHPLIRSEHAPGSHDSREEGFPRIKFVFISSTLRTPISISTIRGRHIGRR